MCMITNIKHSQLDKVHKIIYNSPSFKNTISIVYFIKYSILHIEYYILYCVSQ